MRRVQALKYALRRRPVLRPLSRSVPGAVKGVRILLGSLVAIPFIRCPGLSEGKEEPAVYVSEVFALHVLHVCTQEFSGVSFQPCECGVNCELLP